MTVATGSGSWGRQEREVRTQNPKQREVGAESNLDITTL